MPDLAQSVNHVCNDWQPDVSKSQVNLFHFPLISQSGNYSSFTGWNQAEHKTSLAVFNYTKARWKVTPPTHLTSFPTVIEAMTFFTASFFFSFLSLFSSAFSSKISPASVKYKLSVCSHFQTKPFFISHLPKSLTFLGGCEILRVRHVCSGLSHLAGRRGKMSVKWTGNRYSGLSADFPGRREAKLPPFNRKKNRGKVRRGETQD